MTFKKGDQCEVETQRLAWGGDTVGYLPDGRVCFIRGAPIGEKITVVLTQSKRKFSRGRMLDAFESNICDAASVCGGCPWHLSTSEQQRDALYAHSLRQLSRLPWARGGVDLSWGAYSPATKWRRAARLHWKGTKVGYFAWGTHEVVMPRRCAILLPDLEGVRVALNVFFQRFGVGSGTIRLVHDVHSKRSMLRLTPDVEALDEVDWHTFGRCLWGAISTHISGIEVGTDTKTFYTHGDEKLELGTLRVPHRNGSFAQGNALIVDDFVESISAEVGANQRVLELFCGSGALTVALLQNGCEVHAIDGSQIAIDTLRQTAKQRGVLSGFKGEHTYISAVPEGAFDVCLLDPSRNGAKEAVSCLKPDQFERIVYVSCDLGTLVRDLDILVSNGFSLVRARLFEMFPNSGHVECVVCLVKT